MSPDLTRDVTRRHVTRRPVPSFALAGLLLLAGCSDGEPTAASTPGAGTPTSEAQTTTPDGAESGEPGTQQPTSPASPAETTAAEPGAESGAGSGADNGPGNDGEEAVAETGVEAARAWIDALGNGDLDAAFAVLGDASRQQAGGRAGFESMASALAEGWGAFAYADPAYLPTSLGTVGDGEAGVVTVLATVSQEGTTERRALPLAYRIEAPGRGWSARSAVVEPFVASRAPSSIDQPASGSTVACDVALTASVPTDATAVALGIDGQATLQPEIIPTDSEVDAATAELVDGLSAGEHVLTVAFVDADGRIGAATSIFTVEQGCA